MTKQMGLSKAGGARGWHTLERRLAPRAWRAAGALVPLLCSNLGCLLEDELAGADAEGSSRGGASGARAGGSAGSGAGGNASAALADAGTLSAEGESGIFAGMTAAHNAARAELAPEVSLPELAWSPELAEFAQEWSDELASRCGVIEHRDQNRYGENIALRGSTRVTEPFSPEEAVAGWAAEDACWEFGTIQGSERCDAVCAADINSNGCGHYTQIIWQNTRHVGCGYSTCQAERFTYEVWVCNYDPPGNFIGQTPY